VKAPLGEKRRTLFHRQRFREEIALRLVAVVSKQERELFFCSSCRTLD
jgi:hypothetical protein